MLLVFKLEKIFSAYFSFSCLKWLYCKKCIASIFNLTDKLFKKIKKKKGTKLNFYTKFNKYLINISIQQILKKKLFLRYKLLLLF